MEVGRIGQEYLCDWMGFIKNVSRSWQDLSQMSVEVGKIEQEID